MKNLLLLERYIKAIVEQKDGQIWYHGRGDRHTEFDPTRIAFFTRDKEDAEWYAKDRGSGEEPTVVAATLSMNNPAHIDDLLDAVRTLGVTPKERAKESGQDADNDNDYLYVPRVGDYLRKKGHDGYEGWDALTNQEIWISVVFDANKIHVQDAHYIDQEI